MGTATTIQYIHTAKKVHSCSWCDQRIDTGESYFRYRWFDGGDAGTVKLHPECKQAWDDLAAIDGQDLEVYPGQYPRGCFCEFEDDCKQCEMVKLNSAHT